MPRASHDSALGESPVPHAYQCECQQCRSMAAAIGAMQGDSYVFTDDELLALSLQNNTPCNCKYCRAVAGTKVQHG